MTTEGKFKKLLDIACNNGFDTSNFKKYQFFILKNIIYFYVNVESDDLYIINRGRAAITEIELADTLKYHIDQISINDVVLQTNFFECLFKGWSLYTDAYHLDMFDELRADYVDANGVFHMGDSSFELSCLKNTAVQFKKFEWVLEVEKGTALEWLFNHFNL